MPAARQQERLANAATATSTSNVVGVSDDNGDVVRVHQNRNAVGFPILKRSGYRKQLAPVQSIRWEKNCEMR